MGAFEVRGARNNNPGNIRRDPGGAWTKWQGLAEAQPDAEFVAFRAPVWGVRAIARVLMTYFDHHGCDTVEAIVARWAPAAENDTAAYVKHASRALGVGPGEPIDLHDYATLRRLVETIIRHELGEMPYPSSTIEEALRLVGVVAPPRAAARDPKVIAAAVVTTATVAQQVTAQVADIWDNLAEIGINPHVLLGALGVIAAGAALWFLVDFVRRRRAEVG